MNHTEFLARLKAGDIAPAYLFHGAEEFVKERVLARVTSLVDASVRDLNVTYFEEASADELRAACEAVPFFCERRVVVVRKLPADAQARQVVQWLEQPRENTTILVFFLRGAADKRTLIYKALDRQQAAVEFAPLDAREAARWAAAAAKAMGVELEPAVARHLVALAGTDMARVNNELVKAADYVGRQGAITREAVEAVVSRNLEAEVFDMLGHMLRGNGARAMRALDLLLRKGEHPMAIASFLAGRYRQMLHARLLLDRKTKANDVVKALGGSPYAARKTLEEAARCDVDQLRRGLEAFLDVGYCQVTGQARDRDMLEVAILSALGQNQRKKGAAEPLP